MLCAAKFHLSFDSAIKANNNHRFSSAVRRQWFDLRLPDRHLPSLSVRSVSTSAASDRSVSSTSSECYTSAVGFSPSFSLPLSQWNLTQRHILALNVTASLAAVSATCLFLSAIPALLAFKRAAESLEKLMDVSREELPGTMAAIRLSGMEISDLTMELSDLGQDVTQGVRSSTRAVRVAEERLRQLTNMASSALVQVIPNPKIDTQGPSLARIARGMREGIVKGRAFFQIFFTLTRFSRMAFNYFSKQRAKRL